VEDIAGVNFKKPDEQLAEGDTASDLPNLEPQDGWHESNITIGILSGQESTLALHHQYVPDTPTQQLILGHHYTVRGFWHKSLCMEIMHSLSSDPAAKMFIYDPHYIKHQLPGSDHPEQVYEEMYNSE
ncbi:hypothetical protein TRAPUB_11454, partial [Trametes pubescens]